MNCFCVLCRTNSRESGHPLPLRARYGGLLRDDLLFTNHLAASPAVILLEEELSILGHTDADLVPRKAQRGIEGADVDVRDVGADDKLTGLRPAAGSSDLGTKEPATGGPGAVSAVIVEGPF